MKSKKRIIQIYEEKTKSILPKKSSYNEHLEVPSIHSPPMMQIEIEFVRFSSNRFSDSDSTELSFHNEACKVMMEK